MADRVATYSICACDLDAGQWGVATQSKFLAVGSVVPWAEPHVGAIATQSYANPRYGPDGLALLREGLSGRGGRRAADRRPTTAARMRQLGVVDARGPRRDVHRRGVPRVGRRAHRRGYAAQGNILVSAATVDALAETFEATAGGRSRSGCSTASTRRRRRAATAAAGSPRPCSSSSATAATRACRTRSSICASTTTPTRSPSCVGSTASTSAVRPTPRDEWLAVDDELRAELDERLARLGLRDASRRGPGSRTSRSGWTARTRSTRSCSSDCGRRHERRGTRVVPLDEIERTSRAGQRALAHDPLARSASRRSGSTRGRRPRTAQRRSASTTRGTAREHEELYVVLSRPRDVHARRRGGRRAGRERSCTSPDPAVKRARAGAHGHDDPRSRGKPGEAFTPSAWERVRRGAALSGRPRSGTARSRCSSGTSPRRPTTQERSTTWRAPTRGRAARTSRSTISRGRSSSSATLRRVRSEPTTTSRRSATTRASSRATRGRGIVQTDERSGRGRDREVHAGREPAAGRLVQRRGRSPGAARRRCCIPAPGSRSARTTSRRSSRWRSSSRRSRPSARSRSPRRCATSTGSGARRRSTARAASSGSSTRPRRSITSTRASRRREPQAEHGRRAGLLQQARGRQAHRDRDRRRPVGLVAGVRRRAVRPRDRRLHGARLVRPEAVPARADGDLGARCVPRPSSETASGRAILAEHPDHPAASASRSPRRSSRPRSATTRSTRSARC